MIKGLNVYEVNVIVGGVPVTTKYAANSAAEIINFNHGYTGNTVVSIRLLNRVSVCETE